MCGAEGVWCGAAFEAQHARASRGQDDPQLAVEHEPPWWCCVCVLLWDGAQTVPCFPVLVGCLSIRPQPPLLLAAPPSLLTTTQLTRISMWRCPCLRSLFGQDVLEFVIKPEQPSGQLVTYRSMAGSVKYIWPIQVRRLCWPALCN